MTEVKRSYATPQKLWLIKGKYFHNRLQAGIDFFEQGITQLPSYVVKLGALISARYWSASYEWARQIESVDLELLGKEHLKSIANWENPNFTKNESLSIAYRYITEMLSVGQVNSSTYSDTVRLFGKGATVELAMVVGLYSMTAMAQKVFHIEGKNNIQELVPREGVWEIQESDPIINDRVPSLGFGPASPKAWNASPKLARMEIGIALSGIWVPFIKGSHYELAIMMTARKWNSLYVWNAHSLWSIFTGLNFDVIRQIGKRKVVDDKKMNLKEKAIFDVATELFSSQNHEVSRQTLDNALEVLGERSLIEITTIFGFYSQVTLSMNNAKYTLPFNFFTFPVD